MPPHPYGRANDGLQISAAMYGGETTDALKRVPTPLYGPLKRAEDAIAILLARLSLRQ
jgi:hypothetical protein